jgi:hypothetical protein
VRSLAAVASTESQPASAELATHVATGGFLALAARTTTSVVWRPAARQDWQAELATFQEFRLCAGRRP